MNRSTDPLDPANVIPALVLNNAIRYPDRPAVVEIDRDRTFSWSQLQRMVSLWVGALRKLGIEPGQRVMTMLPPGADAHAVWMACGWLGALEVPVGADYKGLLLRHLVHDSDPEAIVSAAGWANRFLELDEDLLSGTPVVGVGESAQTHAGAIPATDLLPAAPDELGDAPQPWDIAAVMYTSGTTGPSKGVLVPWAQLASGIDAFDECRAGDVLYAPFSPSHLSGKLPLALMAYWAGTHVLRPSFKTQTFWQDVRSHDVNRTWLFHALANFLWRAPRKPDDADNPLETVTGGPLLHEYREFAERFGVEMRTNFGMTEAGWPIVTGSHIDDPLSCGRAREGFDLRIVDEHDREVPVGDVGELIVRSDTPWVMNQGYLGQWEQTVTAWRNGWFHTGDAFRRDERGNYFFIDRIKDAIRRRSENISSFEVEAVVGEHPGVLEVAAIGVPSEFGEEEVMVCVVSKDGSALDPEDLVHFVRPRMPAFMVPRYVAVLQELPKTATGKVRKMDLRRDHQGFNTWDASAMSGNR